MLPPRAPAGELPLLEQSQSAYQIVLPDESPSKAIRESLQQTARLLQTAFQANGVAVEVVDERQRAADRPALLLGDTRVARQAGIDPTTLRDWSYRWKAVGRDVVIIGHDHPARGGADDARRPNWDRVGTAKAAVDFAREHLGVRFLYPELPGYTPISGAARIDLAATPAIEYLKRPRFAVPDELDVSKTPLVRVNTSHPAGGSFYDLAHNRFPRVDEVFGGHTWERAVPAELYDEHPEYFALINHARLKPAPGNAQYCLSNPDVRERIYRDLASWLDQGYSSVDLGQPDGFQPCQCVACEQLYETGKDWSEKIWRFHRDVAQRLEQSHPGRQVTIMSYIQTAAPPKSFQQFPANTSIMLTGTNEEDIAPWRSVGVPRGFTGYVYNWCPNLGTRYTPMRTPGFIEQQVKRLAANHVQALYRDGPGQLFGLEGPVYYTMGRMFDDPERNSARELLPEFCEAAFENKSVVFFMRAFYDELYNAIALYSNHLGTRCDVWTFQSLPGEGRPRKSVTDPFQLIAFNYPPHTLANLESHLKQAEQLATSDKARVRLTLVRTEFEYLKHFARVVHLHQAYQIAPDVSSLQRLLDALDARNAYLATLFDKGHQREWGHVLFPFPGHDVKHLRLAYDGYQEPYANTCFNWDTAALRASPPPSQRRLAASPTSTPVALDSPQWESTTAHELTLVPPVRNVPRKTMVRLLYDAAALHVRFECELPTEGAVDFKTIGRDRSLAAHEAVELYLGARPARDEFYRFGVGADGQSQFDAANGFVLDPLDPRHGKDDPAWNGAWTYAARVDANAASRRWVAWLTIPYATLGVDRPTAGHVWRANFARQHLLPRGQVERSLWSSSFSSTTLEDAKILGQIVFE
ncbi:MAG: DUF4838 domain-containing protein [Pirellulales bacterium]